MTAPPRDQRAIRSKALLAQERATLMGQLTRHIASCGPCGAVGGLDAPTPTRSLCVKSRALLSVIDGLGASR